MCFIFIFGDCCVKYLLYVMISLLWIYMYDIEYNVFFFLKVGDIELKLDLFIDLYKEDRKLLL